MIVDYPGAQAHFLDSNRFGFSTNHHLAIVVHKTGGDATPQDVVNTFLATGKSVHYVIGQDGEIWQLIQESRGAGGNCCPDDSHLAIWNPIIDICTINGEVNLNWGTLSIEHCDPSPGNSTPLTQIQAIQSFRLIWYLMQKYHIDVSHVLGHNTIDRTVCPGNYPWGDLHQYIRNTMAAPPAAHNDLLSLAQKVQDDLAVLMNAIKTL